MEQQETLGELNITENVDNGQTAEIDCPQAVETSPKFLGKFTSVSDLERAYENLEIEYSRKSQLLAELESTQRVVHDTASVASETLVKAEPEKIPVDSQQQIIQNYLASVAVKRQPPTVITTSHDFAYMEKSGRRSIRDASRIAEEFFKSKGANYDNNSIS